MAALIETIAKIQLSNSSDHTFEKNIIKILNYVSVLAEGGAFQTKHGCRKLQKQMADDDENIRSALFGIDFIHVPPKMKKSRVLKLIFRKDNLYLVGFELDGMLYECAGLGFKLGTPDEPAVTLDFDSTYGGLTTYEKNRKDPRKPFLYEVGKNVLIKAVECIMQDPNSSDVPRSLMVLAIHFSEGVRFRAIHEFIRTNYLAPTTASLSEDLKWLINNWSHLSNALCSATEEEVQALLRNREERRAMEARETEEERKAREERETMAHEEMTREEKKVVKRGELILDALDHVEILLTV